jgi:hypothetical protein
MIQGIGQVHSPTLFLHRRVDDTTPHMVGVCSVGGSALS